MALNLGYIEGTCNDRDVVVRIYYDRNWLINDPNADPNLAPLVNNPDAAAMGRQAFCLDIANLSGSKASLTIDYNGGTITAVVQKGDPVTTGPTAGRSRTAAQMAQLGIRTRGDVGNFQISCN